MKKRVGQVGFVLLYDERGAEQRQSSFDWTTRFEIIFGELLQILRKIERQ